MLSRRSLLAGAAGLVVTAGATAHYARSSQTQPASARYLGEALDVMQAHSVKRKSIDWASFRSRAFAELGEASTIDEAYPTVRSALKRLGDNHSFMQTPAEARELSSSRDNRTTRPSPQSKRLEGSIGYVLVPEFVGFGDLATRFADEIQVAIKAVDAPDLVGWIVDLRTNIGGNMWPMIAGLGPILGQGDLGAYIDPDDHKAIWDYKDGAARFNTSAQARVSGEAYRLLKPNPAVAALTGSGTASSGEAVCVSFRGRHRTHSFGEPTYGASTTLSPFKLSDGAVLLLATAVMADRTGRRYGEKIMPDQAVTGGNQNPGQDDPVVQAALGWLPTA